MDSIGSTISIYLWLRERRDEVRPHINLEDLDNDNLSWFCIEPMLMSVRGKSLNHKSDVYNQLNEGQRGLFLFYAFHNHAKSIAEFYWFAGYFVSDLKVWKGLKEGIFFFKDMEMVELLEHLETIIESMSQDANGVRRVVTPSDLEKDINLFDSLSNIFSEYQVLSPITIQKMNTHIKGHQEDFLT